MNNDGPLDTLKLFYSAGTDTIAERDDDEVEVDGEWSGEGAAGGRGRNDNERGRRLMKTITKQNSNWDTSIHIVSCTMRTKIFTENYYTMINSYINNNKVSTEMGVLKE